MAPARRCSACNMSILSRQSADNPHVAHGCGHNVDTTFLCPTAERRSRSRCRRRSHRPYLTFTYLSTSRCRRRRRRRILRCCFFWSSLRHHDCILFTPPPSRSVTYAATAATAAAVNADTGDVVRTARRNCVNTPNTRVLGEEQRHLMTFLYSAALVEKLTLRLSQLRLQTDWQSTTTSSLNDDTKLLASSSPADCDERLASTSSNNKCSRLTTDHNVHVDTISDDTEPCVDEERQTTSMIAMLRRSCRIPRPVAVARLQFMSLNIIASNSS